MGYYIRVFAETGNEIPIRDLQRILLRENLDAQIIVKNGDEVHWLEFALEHRNGVAIAHVEKNSVRPGSLGQEEVEEFRDELERAQPRSAANWLLRRLASIKSIYAFQVLSGADVDRGWDAIHVLFSEIRERSNGFSQADGEGFSNHAGAHITWDFADDVDGDWQMAVLGAHENWETFRMNLGDPHHRASFLSGKIPPGACRIW